MTPWIPVAPLLLFKRPLTDGLTPRGESGVAIPSLPKVRLLARDAWELEDSRRSISNQLCVLAAVNATLAEVVCLRVALWNVLSHVKMNILPAWHLLKLIICLHSARYPWLQLMVLDSLQHLGERKKSTLFSTYRAGGAVCTNANKITVYIYIQFLKLAKQNVLFYWQNC